MIAMVRTFLDRASGDAGPAERRRARGFRGARMNGAGLPGRLRAAVLVPVPVSGTTDAVSAQRRRQATGAPLPRAWVAANSCRR